MLKLVGEVEDDLPIAKVEQRIRINDGDWISLPVPAEPAKLQRVNRDWDLLKHKLAAGDEVTTKLVATDRNETEGESAPIRIVVAAADFDPNRHQTMNTKVAGYRLVKEFAAKFDERMPEINSALAALENSKLDATQAQDRLNKVLAHAERIEQLAEQVTKELVVSLPQYPAGPDAAEAELVARSLATIPLVSMRRVPLHLDAMQQASGDAARVTQQLKLAKTEFLQSLQRAKSIAEDFKRLVTFNVSLAIGTDLAELERHQRRVAEREYDREGLLRQQRITTNLMRTISELIAAHLEDVDSSYQGRLRSLTIWLSQSRGQLETAMGNDEYPEELASVFRASLSRFRSYCRQPVIQGPQQSIGQNARTHLVRLAVDRHVYVRELGRAAAAVEHARKAFATKQEAAQQQKLTDAQRLVNLRRPAIELPKADATFNEASSLANTQMAADARLIRRAVTEVISLVEEDDPDRKLAEPAAVILEKLAVAYATLEAGHQYASQSRLLDLLTERERWEATSELGRNELPRYWFTIAPGIVEASRRLNGAGFPHELAHRTQLMVIGPKWRAIDASMRHRRYSLNPYESQAVQLLDVQGTTHGIVADLQPTMAAARAVIRQYVKKISELAEAAKKDAEELAKQSEQAAEQVAENSPQQEQQQMEKIQDKDDELRKKLAELFDALVGTANEQNLLTG